MTTAKMIQRAAQGGADPTKLHPAVRDLWPTHAGPNVLAWSYRDQNPTCKTLYTVFVPHPGGVNPYLQMTFEDGRYAVVRIERAERFGKWSTPQEFKQWARAWKNAGDRQDQED